MTMFQILTLENWTGVMYDLNDVTSLWSALFFLVVVVFGSLLGLNLIIAILHDAYYFSDKSRDSSSSSSSSAASSTAHKSAPISQGAPTSASSAPLSHVNSSGELSRMMSASQMIQREDSAFHLGKATCFSLGSWFFGLLLLIFRCPLSSLFQNSIVASIFFVLFFSIIPFFFFNVVR